MLNAFATQTILHILGLTYDELAAPAVAVVVLMALHPFLEVLESDSLILLSVLLRVVIVIVTVTEFVIAAGFNPDKSCSPKAPKQRSNKSAVLAYLFGLLPLQPL
jgi:hypothetical protein